MTSKDFGIVEEAFQQALELEGDARQKFLSTFQGNHPNLIDTLNNLLRADENNSDTLAEAVSTSIRTLADEANDPWIDREIGVWKIKSRIGAGGMGAVFLADRIDEQYSQSVAVKILGSQLLDSNAAIRFRTERQILANLNHPHIATLIDGGVTDTDLPYLVMEYVDGVRIDEYCDNNNLSIKERIALFITVCDAVDFAHRNLVVHCDLKPSNILVTNDGVVKLLDFGIAKLIEPEEFDMTIALTAAGARVMTPEYASPEQVRGETVSTTTDVYALGVLLFRLLTGRSPYGNEFTTAHEIQSAILDTDPKRPSTIITETPTATMLNAPSTPDEISSLRGTSIERLRKNLAGDLDTIILKCLQKDAERRYPSPRDIATDLARFTKNEPILARGDSWRYKTGKFIKRNTRAVMATAAVLAMTVSLVSFYTARLADERDKAQLAAAEANQVSEFLTNIFRSADTHSTKGTPITSIDLLEQADQNISNLDDQPILQARLMQIIGDVYASLGKYPPAISLLERSLKVRQTQLSNSPLEYAALLHDLGETYRSSGDPNTGVAFMRRALEERLKVLRPGDDLVIRNRARIAVNLSDIPQKKEAADMLKKALEDKLAQNPVHDSLSVDIFGNIAYNLVSIGEYTEAYGIHFESIKLSEEIDGRLHPNTTIRLSNLARLQHSLYDFESAIETFTDALDRAEKIWPKDHHFFPTWAGRKAHALANTGQFEEALDLHEYATSFAERIRTKRSKTYIYRSLEYAISLINAGRWADAEERLLELRTLSKEMGLKRDNALNGVLTEQAKINNLLNRPAESELLLKQVFESNNILTAERRANARHEFAISFSLQERHVEAREFFELNLTEYENQLGDVTAPLIPILVAASQNERRAVNLVAAKKYATRAQSIAMNKMPANNWIAATAGAELAQVLAAQGKTEEAKQIARPAYEALLKTFGPDDYRVREIAKLVE